jgi:hypothetical protein
MLIELKTQLLPLDMNGLRVLVRDQEARLVKLNNIITAANARIDALRKAAAPAPKAGEVTAQEEQIFKSVAERQLVSAIGEVRRATDKELVPIVKAMQAAAADAKERGERHWDKHSTLRKAKSGNGDAQGIIEAMALRASYAQVLAVCGPVELAKWAQQAIDTGDAILADAVLRENGARKKDEQSFMNGTVLDKLPNAEHEQAQALLNQVIDTAQRGGLAYSEFQRQAPDALRRIELGLKARQRINEPKVGEDGAIRE